MKSISTIITIAFTISFISVNAQTNSSFNDMRDGKSYKTLKAGNQIWMTENLSFKTANGSWCYENKTENCNKYGRLYNWETAKKACPKGWHLPSNEEWKILSADTLAGKKFKETGETNYFEGSADDFSIGSWWTSTEEAPNYASKYWYLTSGSYKLNNHANLINKDNGLSVRCIKD